MIVLHQLMRLGIKRKVLFYFVFCLFIFDISWLCYLSKEQVDVVALFW